MDLKLAKAVGIEAVITAGKSTMKNFKRLENAKLKGKSDIVTEADLKSENSLMKIIRKHFPDDSIISEEFGKEIRTTDYTWLIDPIDGTINFFHGSPPFRIGLCLLKNKKPIMSFIYNPHSNELHFAEKNKGAYKNGKKIHVSNNKELSKTIVLTHISSKINSRARTLLALGSIFSKILHIRVLGCGLAATTYVADGKFDVFFNLSTSAWDIVSGALLVNEAGGKATQVNGKPISLESQSILVTNGLLHNQMLKLLKNV